MAVKVLPQTIADAFVRQYYMILNRCPEKAHKFYQEPSILGWPGPDGVVTPVTSLSGINDKIMSSAYKNCITEIKTRDAQQSLDGGIIIAVTGSFTGKDNMEKNFCQTFFLAKQEKGFYVLNDILRFIDVINSAADNEGINDQPATSVQNSDGKIKHTFDHYVPKEIVAEGAETVPLVASGEEVRSLVALALDENVHSTFAPASNKKRRTAAKTSKRKVRSAVALDSNEKKRTVVAAASTENFCEVAAPALTENSPEVAAPTSTENSASNEQAPSVVAPDPNVPSVAAPASIITEKITYASMVAKEAPTASPRTVRVITKVNKQRAPPPTAKVSAPAGKDELKFNAYAEVTGIYIGRLPYKITKQGLIDVLEKFGTVRRKPDTIQIRRHKDGFCCGFAEFESADSARRAVEAHRVKFGETEAYIAFKRSSAYRGDEVGGKSPTNSRTNPNKGRSGHRRRGRLLDKWLMEDKLRH